MHAVSDEQLIEWVAKGDISCLGALFDRHHRAVYQYCCQLTRDKTQAEDLTQEVFLKIQRKAGSYQKIGSFKAWMFNIARNLTFDYLRKVKRSTYTTTSQELCESELIDPQENNINLIARVPYNADLDISTVNNSKILVSDITGELRLENINGPIYAHNIKGSVIAESVNSDVEVNFVHIDDINATSLNSINGNLKIGLPDKAGVQLHFDNAKGEIYSDFEVDVLPMKPRIEKKDNRNGIEVRLKNVIVANINGGGPIVKLKTLNGSIQVNKHSN